jgi:hypothetical protein
MFYCLVLHKSCFRTLWIEPNSLGFIKGAFAVFEVFFAPGRVARCDGREACTAALELPSGAPPDSPPCLRSSFWRQSSRNEIKASDSIKRRFAYKYSNCATTARRDGIAGVA